MTTNLSVIANVKQLQTGGSFRILLPFFRTSWGVGVLNSTIFNSFHNRVEFGTILEGLRNFGGGGTPKTPSWVRHCFPGDMQVKCACAVFLQRNRNDLVLGMISLLLSQKNAYCFSFCLNATYCCVAASCTAPRTDGQETIY